MNTPELLAPAGGIRQLEAAVRFGADAVYLGLDQLSLRARASNFTMDGLGEASRYAHERSVRVYLTLNIFPYDEDIGPMAVAAREARARGVDAVILSDPGALTAVREAAPGLEIHLSTQANTLNAAAARFWHTQGVRRIILSRELSLGRIRAMRAALPPSLELEAFAHGAACMSYSGRCSLSAYLAGRGANRGDCAQPCRWRYALTEEKRPGMFFAIEENGHPVGRDTFGAPVLSETPHAPGAPRYSHILSAGDLCMIRHLSELAETGLSALKIEGRAKNEYYVATVTGAYRRGLDAIRAGAFTPELANELGRELENVSHRPYDTGFYLGDPERPGGAPGYSQRMEYAGRVVGFEGGLAVVALKNRIFAGDELELMTPCEIRGFRASEIFTESGESVESCGVPGALVRIAIPYRCEPGDLLRGTCRNHVHAE